jgi:K+-sensing histidine kinase KdpD
MANPPDPTLARVLAVAVHEIHNPISVVQGWIGTVLRDKRAEVSAQHREWLELALKSCGRIKEVMDEMSAYSNLEARETALNRTPTDLATLLAQTIDAVSRAPEGDTTIDLSTGDPGAIVKADVFWLKKALASIAVALRRETAIGGTLFVEERSGEYQGKPASWILMGDAHQMDVLRHEDKDRLGWFDDKRGNLGLSLWIARWVIDSHEGGVWAPATAPKGGGAIIALPHA